MHKEIKKKKKDNYIVVVIKGYSVYREFYSPDHSTSFGSNKIRDLRSTLYWQPDIITNEDGEAVIDFFNADSATIYDVVIEGLSEKGKPVSASFSYSVN